jgi:hypothetical protein
MQKKAGSPREAQRIVKDSSFNIMLISATYICPIRGLESLEPPEPVRLGAAARVAKDLGMERLLLPILEESLSGTIRAKVRFLDGLATALDQLADADLPVCLIAPAQKIMGVNWTPPHLVRPVSDLKAGPVYVDGRVRHLRPYDWWEDTSVIQKRMKIFHELIAAVRGHPALEGWIVLDRALEWVRPESSAADLVFRSFLAEIREHDEGGSSYLGLGWSELLEPDITQILAMQVDGLRMGGLESWPSGVKRSEDVTEEIRMAAYLGALSQWLFQRPTEVEIGWSFLEKASHRDEILAAGKVLAGQGLAGVTWLSLIDPEPRLRTGPPWVLRPGLEQIALLDQGQEPKEWVERLLEVVRSSELRQRRNDFIDISPEEYLADPHTHLPRLWDHFLELH